MLDVCLSGARGRMGRMIAGLLHAAEDMRMVSMLERSDHPQIGEEIISGVILESEARSAFDKAGVVVDFSLPDAVLQHLQVAADLGKPFVSGTTGFSEQQKQRFVDCARRIPIVLASNMSKGVYLLDLLVGKAAGFLRGYDAEIFEIHHRNKADAPSGTALKLAETIRAQAGLDEQVYARDGLRKSNEVGISAARGGDVVGEHQVMFLAPGEQLILTHRATTREHFARGALEAVRFVVDRGPGLYGMAEVFGGTSFG